MMARVHAHGTADLFLMLISCLVVTALGAQAQRGQFPTIDILAQPGCDAAATLVPNMQDCVLHQLMGSNGTLTLTFTVGPKPKHSILLTLRSVGGMAEMHLLNSGDNVYGGQVVYYNDAVTESFIRVPADQVIAGQYTLVLQGAGGATQKLLLYLRVQTPSLGVRLAASDKAALQSMMAECCPAPGGDRTPFCSQFLPMALNATSIDQDLCNIGDFVCDEKGHLQNLDFSQAGLDCRKGFPEAFGQLPALETLMLRFNDFNGDTLDNVAAVLAGSKQLRRLMIGSANLTGTVPCALIEEHELRTLMMSSNKLEGALPACVLESTTLQELYMSQTTLSGPLPDAFTTSSSLVVWYSINADQRTGTPAGPGFTGELPSSISNAPYLQYVELSNHQLTGGVPALPSKIVMFEVQGNKLDGGIASPLPASLVYLDCSNNSLTGPVPDFSDASQLTLLDVNTNQLTGDIPANFGAAGDSVVYLDLSRNILGGDINAGSQWEELPRVQYLFMSENNLQGFVPASLGANKQLVALNLGSNLLEGNLSAFASAVNPALAQSPQKGSGRKLQSSSSDFSIDASRLVARKLFGGSEDRAAPQPLGWQHNPENIRALAMGDVHSARRRLQQAAATSPATAPATAPAAPAASDAQVVGEAPAPGGATTTTMSDPSAAAPDTQPQDPTAAGTVPQDQPAATTPPSDNPQLSPAAAAELQQQLDIGAMTIPTSSALQGNSFLYLNLSNNAITGGIPDGLSNLEMFRNPANSTDTYDMFMHQQGGPDRVLDLTNNRIYGEFPLFIIREGDLQSGCSCGTHFSVTDGNFVYCPTKATLAGLKVTQEMLNAIKANNYTCLVPANGPDQPVLLSNYLSKPSNYLTSIPAAADIVTDKTLVTRTPRSGNSVAAAREPASGGAGAGAPLGPGAIAGIVIGAVAGAAIIASLAYFVGYKKFYQVHRATSFRKGALPDGPGVGGSGPYPAAAYGTQPGAAPGFDIETPTAAAPHTNGVA